MTFAKVMQDGDIDGCRFMDRMPTKAEAEVIRARLGILKKREVGEQIVGTSSRGGVQEQEPALTE
jgi:hypothetical protein